MIIRWLRAAGIVVGAALVGLVVWFIGLKGLANLSESACSADLADRPRYGTYRMRGELWLPSFECRLGGNSVPPIVVQHSLEAFIAFGWVVVVPVVYVITALALAVRWTRPAD